MVATGRGSVHGFSDGRTALEDSLAKGDLPRVRTLAHQLKGAGGGYGFAQITEAAASLEMVVEEDAELLVIKEKMSQLFEILRAVVVSEDD